MKPREPDWLLIGPALDRILSAAPRMPVELVELNAVLGRTLAEAVSSPVDHPPWANSAMDGYAVRTPDVRGARSDAPIRLRVIESVAAGEFPKLVVGSAEATQITTGAPLPDGADCVVRVEHTRPVGQGAIDVLDDVDAGRNVRGRGEDMRRGDPVLEAGVVVRPGETGVLAMVGRSTVPVSRRPRVGILSTGNELADLDEFDQVLAGRRIVNSNTYALRASAIEAGADPVSLGIARDDADDLKRHLEPALPLDALVTTAGASVGEHDGVKDALESMGMRTEFWRVRIRPGSPFSFGLLPRPERPDLPVFGLPGNPVSAVVTFEILVKPALRRMLGRQSVYPPTLMVRAAHRIRSSPGLVRFLRVRLERREGEYLASLTGEQGSGIMTSVARADALLVVPLDTEIIEEGETATAVPMAPSDHAQRTPGF